MVYDVFRQEDSLVRVPTAKPKKKEDEPDDHDESDDKMKQTLKFFNQNNEGRFKEIDEILDEYLNEEYPQEKQEDNDEDIMDQIDDFLKEKEDKPNNNAK